METLVFAFSHSLSVHRVVIDIHQWTYKPEDVVGAFFGFIMSVISSETLGKSIRTEPFKQEFDCLHLFSQISIFIGLWLLNFRYTNP